jgi:hypothetical protein
MIPRLILNITHNIWRANCVLIQNQHLTLTASFTAYSIQYSLRLHPHPLSRSSTPRLILDITRIAIRILPSSRFRLGTFHTIAQKAGPLSIWISNSLIYSVLTLPVCFSAHSILSYLWLRPRPLPSFSGLNNTNWPHDHSNLKEAIYTPWLMTHSPHMLFSSTNCHSLGVLLLT